MKKLSVLTIILSCMVFAAPLVATARQRGSDDATEYRLKRFPDLTAQEKALYIPWAMTIDRRGWYRYQHFGSEPNVMRFVWRGATVGPNRTLLNGKVRVEYRNPVKAGDFQWRSVLANFQIRCLDNRVEWSGDIILYANQNLTGETRVLPVAASVGDLKRIPQYQVLEMTQMSPDANGIAYQVIPVNQVWAQCAFVNADAAEARSTLPRVDPPNSSKAAVDAWAAENLEMTGWRPAFYGDEGFFLVSEEGRNPGSAKAGRTTVKVRIEYYSPEVTGSSTRGGASYIRSIEMKVIADCQRKVFDIADEVLFFQGHNLKGDGVPGTGARLPSAFTVPVMTRAICTNDPPL